MLNSPEFKVGFLVVAVAGLIGYMSLQVAEGPSSLTGSKGYWFTVDDAGGLIENSAVKMAGIKVGVIDNIQLVDGRARIAIVLDKDVPMTASGFVRLKSDGILGDRHVELYPGKPTDPPLRSGAPILIADGSGSLNNVMEEVGNITESLNQLADVLTNAASGDGDDSTPIGRIVLNIEKTTADLAEMTGENKEKISRILSRLDNLAANLDTYLNEQSLAQVEQSLANIEEITDKINRGDGTIGRLINDDETVEELNTAITKVNEFLGGADRLETSIDFHSEYLTSVDLTKSYLSLKIKPGMDRYYELAVIDDPRGVTRAVETDLVDRDTGEVTRTEDIKTYKNKIKFTALFAKNFYDFTVKGGLIENAGGIAFDYHLFDRNLRLSTEIFEFDDPYLRAFARYNFFKGVYVIGGGDNLLSDEGEASAFVGGGIFLTNDDLKMLASQVRF